MIENRKIIDNKEIKSWVFEKIKKKMDRLLGKIARKKEKTQNQKWRSRYYNWCHRNFLRRYCGLYLYTNTLDNLEEVDKFLDDITCQDLIKNK